MTNILLVDGNNLLHRSFHGIQGLQTSYGKPTNATYGIVNTVLNWFENLRPEYVFIAFDTKAVNFRKEKYDFYKNGRKPAPEELKCQFDDAKKVLRGLGFYVIEKDGFEGDDLIGTLANYSKTIDDSHTYILSGDRDLLQLVDSHTTMLKIGTKETVTVTYESFSESYGFSPKEYIDAKAIMGDSSDNIPGVYGIGEKGAYKLISEYHTLDNIYENIESLKGKTKERLIEHKEMAYTSKWLATIVTDIDLGLNFSECQYVGYSDNVIGLLKELELNSIISKIQ